MPQTYSTGVVSRHSGASLRQLQWWDERGLIPVPHAGHTRFYGPWEVLQAALFRQLMNKGVTIPAIRKALRHLTPRELQRHLRHLGLRYLVVSLSPWTQERKTVNVRYVAERLLLAHVLNTTQPLVVVDLGALADSLAKLGVRPSDLEEEIPKRPAHALQASV